MRKSRKKFFIPFFVIALLAVSVCGFFVYWDNHGIVTKIDSIEEIAEYGGNDFFGNKPFEYKSTVFRAVTGGVLGYPKQMGFVGISESKKTIYYLWFYDFDLDLTGNMIDFVIKNFKQTI